MLVISIMGIAWHTLFVPKRLDGVEPGRASRAGLTEHMPHVAESSSQR
jgi:hypothetical protein